MQNVVEIKIFVDAQVGFAQLGKTVLQRLYFANQIVNFRHFAFSSSGSLKVFFRQCGAPVG